MSVLAVGTVALDSVETPFGAKDNVLGGSATYITLAARYFCEPIRLVGVVGGDFPEEYVAVLRDNGVDLDGLEVQREGKTFAWKGRYHYDLNNRDTLETMTLPATDDRQLRTRDTEAAMWDLADERETTRAELTEAIAGFALLEEGHELPEPVQRQRSRNSSALTQ